MRHRKAGSRLGRDTKHRQALMKNLALNLFEHNAIQTGLVKAKELRRFAEPIITLAKRDNVANRRRAFAILRDDAIVAKLFKEIGPAFAERPGGYTRILRLDKVRVGDACQMARIELVGLGEAKKAS